MHANVSVTGPELVEGIPVAGTKAYPSLYPLQALGFQFDSMQTVRSQCRVYGTLSLPCCACAEVAPLK